MAELENLESLVKELSAPEVQQQFAFLNHHPVILERLYCNKCRATRRVAVTRLFTNSVGTQPIENYTTVYARLSVSDFISSAHMLQCVECSEKCLAVIYEGPDGARLALLRSNLGGISTENTPEGVKYYLDQAARAESVTAYSAALVMYRSALEHLLHHLGFKTGMLRQKIDELKQKREVADAPRWIRDLDVEDLSILGRLGNGAVHTNDGDVTKQDAIDHALVVAVRLTFSHILDDAIERVKKDAERKTLLKSAASQLR